MSDLHYFIHGPNIAAVEDAGQAEKYAALGWERVSHRAFIAAWAARDAQAWEDAGRAPVHPLVRAAGEGWRAPWRLIDMPRGE